MIIVVGLAGSGKSTQCQMLEETGRYKWLSVGQLLRTKITDYKQKVIIDSGDILDDQTVLPLVLEEIKTFHLDSKYELVLDGFPRTLDQSKWLLERVAEEGITISKVINIIASEEATRPRLLSRGRSDDHEAAINERFNEYESQILPILEYFRSRNISISEVNGENSTEAVPE
jgi:adenylate kinase